MSKRPFITQDDSPNIIIVPTVSFCEPQLKKIKVVNNDQANKKWGLTPSCSKQPEPSSETICDELATKSSGTSSSRSEDSGQCITRLNDKERPSWASNYLLSIGDINSPIKINLSSTRKKIETLKEKTSKKKTTQLITPQTKETKNQQRVGDDLSCNTSNCSHLGTEYSYNENRVKSTEPLLQFDETKTTMITQNNVPKNLKNVKKQYSETRSDKGHKDNLAAPSSSKYIAISDNYMKNCNKRLNEAGSHNPVMEKIVPPRSTNETRSEKQYKDKSAASFSSKYIQTPYRNKLIKYDQNTNDCVKWKKDFNDSYCETKISGDKIKHKQKFQSSKNKTINTPQKTLKSKVIKKSSPIKKTDNTSYLYDLQTLKCKEFYNNYKIPKISDKNNKQEHKIAEPVKDVPDIVDDVNKDRLSAKNVFVKELDRDKCSPPVKSIINVVGDSKQTVDTNFDLRSKLSRRSLNHYFTKLRNLTESEPMDKAPREQRDSLLITVPNDTDENLKDSGKRKLEDNKITSNNKELKVATSKFKKIKLVINVICEKSVTSSSDSEDEGLDDTEKSNVISNLDLSFLDDFNIDEIVESLCRKETRDLSPIESQDNALKDFSFNDNAHEINNNKDINITNTKMFPLCPTHIGNERTCSKYKQILKTGDSLLNDTPILTDFSASEINEKRNETIISTSNQSIDDRSTKANEIDESLPQNGGKLLMTNLLNFETEDDKNFGKSDVFSTHEQNCLKTVKKSDTFIVSNVSVIPNMTGEEMCKETKPTQESDKVSTVLEASKTNKFTDKSYGTWNDNQESQEMYNTLKIRNVNYAPTDLIEQNTGETISAIRIFLENHSILQLNKECHGKNVNETNNFSKEISSSGRFSAMYNTNSNNIESFHSICSNTNRESSEMYNNINQLEIIETEKLLDTTEDIKKYQESNQNPLMTNVDGNCDTNKVTRENKDKALESSGINDSDNVEATGVMNANIKDIKIDHEKIKDLVIENAVDIECDTYDNMNKNYTVITKHVSQFLGTNTTNNKDNNKDEIEIEEQPKDPTDDVKQDDTVLEFEAATESCLQKRMHISHIKANKIKRLNNDLSILSTTDISGIIDLTNESDEDVKAFEEKCDEPVNITTENKEHLGNVKVTEDSTNITESYSQTVNDKFVTKSTKNELELKIINIEADEDPTKMKIENSSLTQKYKSVNETTKYEGEFKTESTISVDDASVTKTKEHKLESKSEDSSQADENDKYVNKSTEVKPELKIEHKRESKSKDSSQADEDDKYVNESTEVKSDLKIESSNKSGSAESVTKLSENKHQTETTNTCQATSIIKKTIAISKDKSKEKSDVTKDLKETDVYLAKRLEDRMQQYLNKKHTITSLLHFGSFSKIYECVSENGEKYALKMMDGNKIYRNSKVENIMNALQKDVPKQNYHCIFLLNGFGFTKHWCILMDLYPKNLKQALQENKKSFHINVIQNLSRQLVSAVTLLRHNNIVHTDIKPTHILVNSANDQLKLCGFDEARYKNCIPFTTNIGTVSYLAPEVILGHSANFKMDVWSTALVMYEMATNIQLFPGTEHNDILFMQMWECGPVPYEMLQQSRNKNCHFNGLTFMRKLNGGKYTEVPYHIMRKHDLVKKYVYLTYKNDWHGVTSYKQKKQDYAKLLSFCQLLKQMLVIDPQLRLPIEFVCADPFIFESFNDN